MIYKNIIGTKLNPSCICLGTAEMGTVMPEADAFRMLDCFVDRGGNFLDSAHVYGDMVSQEKSVSEKTIGRWLMARRNRNGVIVATKGGHPALSSMHLPRLSGEEITRDLEESLLCLGVDYIDLYWLHRDDPARPVGEIIETLDAQVKKGKIRYYGLSNWQIPRLAEALTYAQARGLACPCASQILWSLAEPNKGVITDPSIAVMDDATLAFHRQTSMAAIPYTSQARGFFSKLREGSDMQDWVRATYQSEQNSARYERAKALAGEHGTTLAAIILGYLTAQPFPTIPVISCRNLTQLSASLEASDLQLPPGAIQYLESGTQSQTASFQP